MTIKTVFFQRFWIQLLFLVLLSSCVNKQKDREQAIDPVAVEEAPAMDESYQAALRQNLKDLNSMDSKVDEARKSARLYEELRWLQGTWEWSGNIHLFGSQHMKAKVLIDGDYITSIIDGDIIDEGKIRDIDMEEQKIHFGRESYLAFNKDSKKLYTGSPDGACFHKVSNRVSSSGYGSRNSSDLSYQTNDINDMSWLYGSWRLETGGFIFWIKITKDNLKWEVISFTGIPHIQWDGNYKLYMNRIEINGSPALGVDLYRKKIYTLKGEAFQKR